MDDDQERKEKSRRRRNIRRVEKRDSIDPPQFWRSTPGKIRRAIDDLLTDIAKRWRDRSGTGGPR